MTGAEFIEQVKNTPEDPTEYVLGMWNAGADVQQFSLARDEFIALKQHLAVLRAPE